MHLPGARVKNCPPPWSRLPESTAMACSHRCALDVLGRDGVEEPRSGFGSG